MPFIYNAKTGYFQTVFRITHTVLPLIFRRYEFWVFIGLHLSVNVCYRLGFLHGVNHPRSPLDMEWESLHVISAFTTFFQVFYTNSCFERYHELHDATRAMIGNMYECVFELCLHIKDKQQSHLRLATRFLMASVLMFFYEQDDCISENEWAELHSHGIVKVSERKVLEQITTRQRSLLMLHWSAEVGLKGLGKVKAPNNILKSSTDKILMNRELQQKFMDTRTLPMPFQYYHFLKSMICVNLTLWAYRMGITESIFAPFNYCCAALITMGMAELAEELSDPFGPEEVDFPVSTWLAEAIENIIFLVECPVTFASKAESMLDSETSLAQGPRQFHQIWREGAGFSGVDAALAAPPRPPALHVPVHNTNTVGMYPQRSPRQNSPRDIGPAQHRKGPGGGSYSLLVQGQMRSDRPMRELSH